MIRCKFFCSEVGEAAWVVYDYETKKNSLKKVYKARMSPVCSGSEENKKFFDATPQGSFEVSTVAEKYFEAGKEYYIDITAAN